MSTTFSGDSINCATISFCSCLYQYPYSIRLRKSSPGMPILCAFTWFYLFFFKWAADFHSLPLPWDYRRNTEFIAYPQQSFISMFVCLLIGSYFRVTEILYRQCVALDIFFVDWEKARYADRRSGNDRKKKKLPVSVWRTIKIANEWMKLQTARRANFEVTLMSVLFLLVGCDVRRYAVAIPEVYVVTSTNIIFLFLFFSLHPFQ